MPSELRGKAAAVMSKSPLPSGTGAKPSANSGGWWPLSNVTVWGSAAGKEGGGKVLGAPPRSEWRPAVPRYGFEPPLLWYSPPGRKDSTGASNSAGALARPPKRPEGCYQFVTKRRRSTGFNAILLRNG